MSNWHFINLPYVKNALFAQPPGVRNSSNVAWGIQSSNYTVWTSRSKTLDKARFLRFMIHFAGDIHQPLHAATMFDQSLFPPPVGDEGAWRARNLRQVAELASRTLCLTLGWLPKRAVCRWQQVQDSRREPERVASVLRLGRWPVAEHLEPPVEHVLGVVLRGLG